MPSSPESNSRGIKTTTTVRAENKTEGATVCAASTITEVRGFLCVASKESFSASFRRMTSVKIIAASTMSPIATANPPSVITLTPRPSEGKISNPIRTEIGMVARTMIIVLSSNNVTRRTIITIIAASRATSLPPSMDLAIKSAWRYASVVISIPLASAEFEKSSRTLLSALVSSGVFPPGDF